MKLVKHCKSEHNIHKGAKLQIGSLYAYHDIENEEIKDGEEGKYTFTYSFPEEIELDIRLANLLFSGAIGFGSNPLHMAPRIPGSFVTHVNHFELVRQTKGGVVIRNSSATVERTVPNQLIFCMSLQQEDAPSPFDGYDDRWSIEMSFADRFAGNVAGLLLSQIRLENYNPEIGRELSINGSKKLGLNVRHQPVQYSDRSETITPGNLPTFGEFMKKIIDIPFVKPSSFSNENEYRFTFELTDGNMIFPPAEKFYLLDINAALM